MDRRPCGVKPQQTAVDVLVASPTWALSVGRRLAAMPPDVFGVQMTPTTTFLVRLRSWLAGKLFVLAGRLDSAYDVWLDDASPRHRETSL
jgi:hypothetical protein